MTPSTLKGGDRYLSSMLHLTLRDRWANTKDELRSYRNGQRGLDDLLGILPRDDVALVTRGHLRQLVAMWRNEDASPATRNRRMSAVMAVLTTAHEHGHLDTVPKVPREVEPRKPKRLITADEALTLCEFMLPVYAWITQCLYETGARVGEILEADWAVQGGCLSLRDTKNGDDREIPVDITKITWYESFTAFPTKSQYHKAFSKARKAAGLSPEVTVHGLRHSCCTRLVRAGVPLPTVQKWMGHRDIQTTMRYVHVDPADLEEAARKLRGVTL